MGPIGLGLGVLGILQGTLGFDRQRLSAFLALLSLILIGMSLHAVWPAAYGVSISMNSLVQFLLLTSFLTLSFAKRMDELVFFRQVNSYFVIIAVAGIIQFIAQFFGLSIFSFDGILPGWMLIEFGWNLQIPSGVAGTLKSNGFFLLEPSIFSQFMAIALIIEVLAFKRMLYVTLFITGLFLSFSGTGWIILAAFFAGLGASLGVRGLILAAVSLLILGVLLALVVNFSPDTGAALAARSNEISTPMTSGHMRFVTPFWLLSDVLTWVPSAIFVGIGGGTSEHLPMTYLYNTNIPIKTTLEYGLPAFIAYFSLFLLSHRTALQRAIVLPAVAMVMFTGNYAQFPPVLFLVALIICVAKLSSAAPQQRSQANSTRPFGLLA